MTRGAEPWIAKPVCDCCGSRDRAELVGDRVLCPTCAEED